MSIIDVFSQAIEISDPDERMAYVKRACGDDASLHQQVRQMLEQYYDPKTFMANAAIDANAETALDLTSPSEKPGDEIGSYKLLEQIGEGGMGVIYLAEQREPIARRVALKIIKRGMDTKQVLARFEAERQALAMMNHPNIAKILDAGSTESGRPYFVMELVQGLPITDYCNQYNLDTTERLELFTHVCNAVQHAHQKGIIHRDIKPSNVLVASVDDQPIPKVIDFGIAKATEQRLTEKTLFTNFQLFIGTPAYMSPEQAQIGAQDIDTRSDVYSLGVLLYELLTGRTPFSNEELMSGGYEEVRRRVRESEPLIPSKKLSSLSERELTDIARLRKTEVATLNKALRGELDWIIMKALEKNRTRRFDTANLLRLDIECFLRNEPVSAVAPSAWYLTQKFARRHRAALLAGSAILVFLLAAVAVSSSGWVEANRRGNLLQVEYEKVKTSEATLRQRSYDSGVALASRFIGEGNNDRAYRVLQSLAPQSETEADLRGFEWRYLMGQCQPVEVLDNESDGITGLAVSPDGMQLAVATRRSTKVWDLATRRVSYQLEEQRRFSSVVFQNGGEQVVSIKHSRDSDMLFIDLPTQKTNRIVSTGVSTYPSWDLKWVGAKQDDDYGFLNLLDNTFTPLKRANSEPLFVSDLPVLLPLNDREAMCLSYHVEDDYSDHRFVIDRATGEILIDLGDGKQFSGYHHQRRLLATPGVLGNVKLFDLEQNRLMEDIPLGSGCRALRFSPDGTELALTTHDARLLVWDLTRREIRHVGSLGNISLGLDYFPDGKRIVTGDHYGKLRIWTPDRSPVDHVEIKLPAFARTGMLRAYSICQSENRLAIGPGGAEADQITIITVPNLQAECVLSASEFPLYFTPDDQALMTVSGSGIQRWDLSSRKMTEQLPLQPSMPEVVLTPTLSPDRLKVALVDRDGQVSIYSLQTGLRTKQLGFTTWHGSPGVSQGRVAFSPDSEKLALFSVGEIKIVNLVTGEVQSLKPEFGSILSFAFMPDGNSVVAAGFTDLRHWDLISGQATELGPLTENLFVTVSPDGKTLLTSGQRSVRLWNAQTKQELIRLKWPGGDVTRAVFDPKLRFLTVVSDQESELQTVRSIRLYRAPSFDQIETQGASHSE